MPYINVDEAYILDNTGLQVDMTTDIPFADAGFSDTQKEQARKNIGAGSTNPNLLDNWYFVGGGSQLGDGVFPINQRGLTSYTGGGGKLDRWKHLNGNGTLTLTANGIVMTATGDLYLSQVFGTSAVNAKSGAWTISVKTADGTVYSKTYADNDQGLTLPSTTYIYAGGSSSLAIKVPAGVTSETISAIKLEKGSVSTLANDIPPVFSEELAKCQHYLWQQTFPVNAIIGIGTAISATQLIINIDAPVAMRNTAGATITFNANVGLLGDGGIYTAASITGINIYDNHIRLVATSSGLTAYKNYTFFTLSETTMMISNEL